MSSHKFSTFYLNDQLFGIDILMIREINKQLDLTVVPHAPDFICGLVNLRGQIVTIIDLKNRLGLGQCEITQSSHNIILKTESELSPIRTMTQRHDLASIQDKVGLLVDEVGDVITVEADEIESPPANMGPIDGKYISGVAKLNDSLMVILSGSKILHG